MEAILYPETSIPTRATWRYIPEDDILYSDHHEKPKYYIVIIFAREYTSNFVISTFSPFPLLLLPHSFFIEILGNPEL
jgi:hypothetical protein